MLQIAEQKTNNFIGENGCRQNKWFQTIGKFVFCRRMTFQRLGVHHWQPPEKAQDFADGTQEMNTVGVQRRETRREGRVQ
jgi:hypothetical protein